MEFGSMSESKPAISIAAMARRFSVAVIEKVTAPDGAQGQDWYRYILESESSTIVGQRRGSRRDVSAYARECVDQLNERAASAKSIWSPRGRKSASAS